MSRKRFTAEKVIEMLWEAEVFLAQGKTVGEICRSLGVSEQSYYRWCREYGGVKLPCRKTPILVITEPKQMIKVNKFDEPKY